MKTNKRALLQIHVETTDYQIREEQIRELTYWVVPVVMMVEGVHHGSRGPLMYSSEELAASISGWNGVPVTIGHPTDDKGKYISANLPNVLKGITGRIYNAKMRGDKLTAEAWIDVSALANISSEAFEYIKEKKALDVSVGVFSEEQGEEGEFNGEIYRAEATNLIPDHLALLPGEEGACSWEDGCGIRTNSNSIKMKTEKTKETKTVDKKAWLAAMLLNGFFIRSPELTANEASFNQITSSIQDQLNSMDNDMRVYYLEEVYDSYFVYCTVNRETRERSLYKRNYSVKADGAVEFQGDPTQVRREVSFINMVGRKRTNFNFKHSNMNTNKKKCACSVDSLIENQATNFTEDDREWLSELAPEQLEKLAPVPEKETPAPAANTAVEEKKKENGLVSKNADGSISINGKSIGDYVKEELAKEADPVKFIDNFMPEGLKEQMKSGLKMYETRRSTLIKEIAANSKFKEAQLKDWKDEDLAALHASLVEEEEGKGVYSPLGGGGSIDEPDEEGSEEEMNAMLSFAVRKPEPKKEDVKK